MKLSAWLCVRFGLTSENVIRHYDVTGKNCPKYYVENPDAWIQMKSDIAAQIDVDYGLQDVQSVSYTHLKEKQQVEKTKEQQSKAEKSENSYEPYAARDHSSDRVDHNKSGQ